MLIAEYEIPVKTVSEANVRCHWSTRYKRAKHQREAACLITCSKRIDIGHELLTGQGTIVTLTRLAPRLCDSDNLAGSMKAVRDGIADGVGINDGDERVEWRYGQAKSKEYSVKVVITASRNQGATA